MYTDALQGSIMFIGMLILFGFIYWITGGFVAGNQALTNLIHIVPSQTTAVAAATGFTGWTSMPSFGSPFWWTLVSTLILGVGIGVLSQPQLAVRFMTVKSNRELNRAVLIGGIFIFVITVSAYVVGALSNVYFFNTLGKLAIQVVNGNADNIMPAFISAALPLWFAYVFMITLLSAAMSTLSAQFHLQGTALGHDIFETVFGRKVRSSVLIARLGIIVGVIIAVILGFILPPNIIAVGTAIWYSIAAAAFLSMYAFACFWKRSTKAGVITGLVVGTFASIFWLVFEFGESAGALGICKAITGKTVLVATAPWPTVDSIVIALPIAFVLTVVVSLLTKPPSKEHLEKCFSGIK
jgi:SSS family solute:Na+ symporter